MSWLNLVPAVAVRQERLVFFIFIRYKGYLDGCKIQLELKEKFLVLIELEIKCLYTIRTVKWKQNFIKTDVKGRRCGYRIGLETLVDHTENYECHI